MAASQARIGCAGWSIPRQHAHLFGEGESVLARYATRFSVVEVNSSFYRPHQARTWERWAASVPRDFRFSVKLPQAVSHQLRLRATGPVLDRFLGEVAGLGTRLGGFLLQLPPSLAWDGRTASAFFRAFRNRSDAPLACEPRHASWFTPAVAEMLGGFDVSRAAADPARFAEAGRPAAGVRWPYWRWHGSPRIYYSDYSEAALRELARLVTAVGKTPLAPWVIFDNTAQGFAAANAARLQDLLGCGQSIRATVG